MKTNGLGSEGEKGCDGRVLDPQLTTVVPQINDTHKFPHFLPLNSFLLQLVDLEAMHQPCARPWCRQPRPLSTRSTIPPATMQVLPASILSFSRSFHLFEDLTASLFSVQIPTLRSLGLDFFFPSHYSPTSGGILLDPALALLSLLDSLVQTIFICSSI